MQKMARGRSEQLEFILHTHVNKIIIPIINKSFLAIWTLMQMQMHRFGIWMFNKSSKTVSFETII